MTTFSTLVVSWSEQLAHEFHFINFAACFEFFERFIRYASRASHPSLCANGRHWSRMVHSHELTSRRFLDVSVHDNGFAMTR